MYFFTHNAVTSPLLNNSTSLLPTSSGTISEADNSAPQSLASAPDTEFSGLPPPTATETDLLDPTIAEEVYALPPSPTAVAATNTVSPLSAAITNNHPAASDTNTASVRLDPSSASAAAIALSSETTDVLPGSASTVPLDPPSASAAATITSAPHKRTASRACVQPLTKRRTQQNATLSNWSKRINADNPLMLHDEQ